MCSTCGRCIQDDSRSAGGGRPACLRSQTIFQLSLGSDIRHTKIGWKYLRSALRVDGLDFALHAILRDQGGDEELRKSVQGRPQRCGIHLEVVVGALRCNRTG